MGLAGCYNFFTMFYRLVNFIVRSLLSIFSDFQITGQENIPRSGPLIVAINHIHFIDALIPGLVIPRRTVGMAKVEAFRTPGLGLGMRLYGAFPVQRGQVDRRAINRALAILRYGGAFAIAPEGTRSKTGGLQKARDGVTFVALRSGAPILPVAIAGTNRVFPEIRRLRRAKVRVVIGKPFRLRPEGVQAAKDEIRRMTDEIMFELAALLPEEYRGVYGRCQDETHRYIVFPEPRGAVIGVR